MCRRGKFLRVPGDWGSQISRQSAYEGSKVVSLYPSGIIPGTHFRWRLSRPQGHSVEGRGIPVKKIPWHYRESNPRGRYVYKKQNLILTWATILSNLRYTQTTGVLWIIVFVVPQLITHSFEQVKNNWITKFREIFLRAEWPYFPTMILLHGIGHN